MHKMWVVIKTEFLQVVQKKSFLIGIILTPLFMIGITMLPAMLASRMSDKTEKLAVLDQSGRSIGEAFANSLDTFKIPKKETPAYSVEQIFRVAPSDTTRFASLTDSLDEEIKNKDLLFYLVIGENPEQRDSALYLVSNTEKFRSINRFERSLSAILSTERLLQSSVSIPVDSVLNLTRPLELQIRDTTGEAVPFQVKYFGAFIFVMIMFSMIIGYGQIMMRSIIEEKGSRIIEVLISSIRPMELMMGKVLGLGAAAMTQVAVWVLLGGALYLFGGAMAIDINSSVAKVVFNPLVVFFFVSFLLVGYLLYSSLFALIGSMVNSDKEAQSFIFPITMSVMLPVLLALSIIQEPNSFTARLLSFIPFFAPTMMVMRVVFVAPTEETVSFVSGIGGEAMLSLIVTIIGMIGIIWIASRVFRVGILMYGKRPTLPEILKWVRYK